MKKAVLTVIDGLGIGQAPDSALYGDEGSNTLKAVSVGIKIPNLIKLGLGEIDGIDYLEKNPVHTASVARLRELSAGKDTTTGHFEIAGLEIKEPFPTYPQGFPNEVIDALEKAFGTKILGNIPASGTQIIEELGPQHLITGYPIVYTSADSVLQIACHEDVTDTEGLYGLCRKARAVMSGKHGVSRIIARPFAGRGGSFYRTDMRKDFSIEPPGETLLDKLMARGYGVFGIGKINDIFAGRGITRHFEAHGNNEVGQKTIEAFDRLDCGLVFANFVDTDMLYGHRNDVVGFKKCVESIDVFLPSLTDKLDEGDLLIITADHGCDPSTPSTDHSREYVPLLVYQKSKRPKNMGTLDGFFNISRILHNFFNL